jgi:hypothetical protein
MINHISGNNLHKINISRNFIDERFRQFIKKNKNNEIKEDKIFSDEIKNLENKLNYIKFKQKKEKEDFLLQLGEFNLKLSEKDTELRRIIYENRLLYNIKKDIFKEHDSSKKMEIILDLKNKLLENKEKDLESKIKLKENIIENIKIELNELKYEIDIKKNLTNYNNNEEIVIKLKKELEDKNNIINKLNVNINDLKKISIIHKLCDMNKNNKNKKFLLLKEEHKRLKDLFPYNKISKLFRSSSSLNFSTIQKGKNSIQRIFDILEKSKSQRNLKNNSLDNLFKKPEKKVLSYLIPEVYMIKFQDKFQRVSSEKSLLEYKLKKKQKLLIEKNKENKNKCFINDMNNYREDIKQNVLNQHISNYKYQSLLLQKHIRTINKERDEANKLYKEKNIHNIRLKKQINYLINLINKGELKLKKKGFLFHNSNKILLPK